MQDLSDIRVPRLSNKAAVAIVALLFFVAGYFVMSFFMGDDDAPVEIAPIAEVTVGDLSTLVIEPLAVPIRNADGEYIGNAFTRITIEYLVVDGIDEVSPKLGALQDAFSARMVAGDLFQEGSSLLDLGATSEALKTVAKQMVDKRLIKAITVEPTFHQDP